MDFHTFFTEKSDDRSDSDFDGTFQKPGLTFRKKKAFRRDRPFVAELGSKRAASRTKQCGEVVLPEKVVEHRQAKETGCDIKHFCEAVPTRWHELEALQHNAGFDRGNGHPA